MSHQQITFNHFSTSKLIFSNHIFPFYDNFLLCKNYELEVNFKRTRGHLLKMQKTFHTRRDIPLKKVQKKAAPPSGRSISVTDQ